MWCTQPSYLISLEYVMTRDNRTLIMFILAAQQAVQYKWPTFHTLWSRGQDRVLSTRIPHVCLVPVLMIFTSYSLFHTQVKWCLYSGLDWDNCTSWPTNNLVFFKFKFKIKICVSFSSNSWGEHEYSLVFPWCWGGFPSDSIPLFVIGQELLWMLGKILPQRTWTETLVVLVQQFIF